MEKVYSTMLANEFKTRVIDESFNRIRVCLSLISDEDLNKSPGLHVVPVSNQIKHVCGNIRQWVLSALSGKRDERDRDAEFEQKYASKTDLLDRISKLELELLGFIENLSDEQLLKEYTIQGFEVSGLSALIHVIEHCSYHTGQITLLTKMYSQKETGYYDGLNLNVKNS